MDEEERRRDVLHVPQRRLRQRRLFIVPRIDADLIAPEVGPDVARPPEGPPARDGPVGDRGLEPVGLGDDPIRHESAVRAPGDREPLPVDERVFRGGEVQALHEILVVPFAVVPSDVGERLRVTVASARIQEEDGIALRREDLEFMDVAVPEGRLRAPVDVQDGRDLSLLGGRDTQPSMGTPSLALKTNGSGLRMPSFFRASSLKDVSFRTPLPTEYSSAGAPFSIAVKTILFALIWNASMLRFPSTSTSAFLFRTSKDSRCTAPPSATRK